MSRDLVRRASVMIVIIALTLVALPAANARPLTGPHATAGSNVSWISAFSTWAASFFLGTPANVAPTSHVIAKSTTPIIDYPKMHPMTGSCVDPNGKPIPCSGS